MKALEEYQQRQRQLHELRVTMIHVMAVGSDVILCPIDLIQCGYWQIMVLSVC